MGSSLDAWLNAPGQMSRLIAAHDWSASLGPIGRWPASLRTTVSLMLYSPVPMVLLWGEDGIMIYNDAYSRFAGGRHPKLLGSRVREGWPEVADFNDNVMRVGLAGGTLAYQDQELQLARRGQLESVWMNLDYSPVFDESGRPGGVIAVVVETTERVRTEAALRANAQRLRFLDELHKATADLARADDILAETTRRVGEHLNVSICAYADMDDDEDGFAIRGDWAAPGSGSIVGRYRLADFGKLAVRNLGAGLPLVINDSLAELEPQEAATFRNIGIAATICMPLVKRGKLTALMAIHDKAPRIWSQAELSLLSAVTERSWAHVERVGAEAEVRASEETFRTLARAMPNQVWTARPDGAVDWVNAHVREYFDIEPGEADGARWFENLHPDDRKRAQNEWSTSLNTGETYEAQFRIRRSDGVWRWHLARAVPLKGAFGEIVSWIGTSTDIHDQVEAASALADINAELERRVAERGERLAEAEDALRQAQKMEAVGQLTGGLAHDFNNLLTGISGSLEMLSKRLAEGRLGELHRYIEAAGASASRAAALTQRLLAFSRRQTLAPTSLDANRLISGMAELIDRTIGPDIALKVVQAPDLWTVRVDASQLENALLNLCINARDAMAGGGGSLVVESANLALDESASVTHDLPAGEYVVLSVTDTGAGMTEEIKRRAFDPFFTTKPIGSGTGLGLSMIYGFVRQSGGQVRIYSEIGRGTSVRLYLPRWDGEAAEDSIELLAPAAPGRGENVLVVDDEDAVRMLVLDVLADQGYASISASDGQAAMKIIETSVKLDLLITDVGLPGGMNGRQLADAARALRPDLKVLFITGYAENAVLEAGHLEPGMEVVTKPFATGALGGRVRALLDRG